MLYLIDGSGFVFRAFHALPPLKSKENLNVGAVFGFAQMLKSIIYNQLNNHDRIIVVFDKDGSKDRKELYKEYKANRPKPPEELILQFPLIKKVCKSFNVPSVELSGYEADDIIGTICNLANEEITIVSSDKDLMQLVNKNVKMFDPIKKIIIDEDFVYKKLNVYPSQVVDYLGLVGDASDNIPGVPSVGPKNAAKLLNDFKNIEGILENIEKIESEKLKSKFYEFKEQAILSKKLASLINDVPFDTSILNTDYKKEIDVSFFKELGFESIIKNITENSTTDNKADNTPDMVDVFEPESYIGVETKDDKFILTTKTQGEIVCKTFEEFPKKFNSILKITFNQNNLIEPFEDIKLLAYVVNEKIDEKDQLINTYEKLKHLLIQNRQVTLYEQIERPLTLILKNMSEVGIKIDINELKDLGDYFDTQIKQTQQEIFKIVGYEFNVSSSKQVAKALFEDLNLKPKGKGKSGTFSTDFDVLESMFEDGFEIASFLLRYRELTKLKTTYVDGLLKHVKDNIIHTTFDQAATLTGRLSSSNPNLQNIPIKTEEGRKIRHCFISRGEKLFYSFDYSQIELRLLSHFADIFELKEAFKNGIDVHSLTAKKVFKTDNITPSLRRAAKIINFGILYGVSAHGLSKQIRVSRVEAASIIESYFNTYPGILNFMKEREDEAKRFGYVTTLFGRRCLIDNINSSKANLRNFAKRQAINAPLQGSSADIIKMSMVRLKPFLNDVTLLLQVHDELLFEIDDKNSYLIPKIKSIMESFDELTVPIEVNVKSGKRWSDL